MLKQLAALPKYETYKDSGIEWLGEIPEHWDICPLGIFADVIDPQPDHRAPAIDPNGLPYIGIRDVNADGTINQSTARVVTEKAVAKQESAFTINDGDIVFCKVGTLGEPRHIKTAGSRVALSATLVLIKTKNDILTRYTKYILDSDAVSSQINRIITGATRPALGIQQIRKFRVFVPSSFEQKSIVIFLDQKTTQIDQAIAIKEKQISLLKERKQIMIQNAVTRGLDPCVPMRDSGVEWIGEIPEHWELRRSKFLFNQRTERARKGDIQLSATQAYGVISQEEYERKIGRKVTKIQLHLDKRRHVEIDDFVISMRSFQGGLERAWAEGCIRSSYVVLKPLQEVDAEFYSYLFKLPRYIEALQSTGNFIRDGQDLNFDNFSRVDLFIPPLNEQKKIAAYIGKQLALISKAINLQQQQIDKLKEYKATLINSAVTGKIKVPMVQAEQEAL